MVLLFSDVLISDRHRCYFPRAVDSTSGQSLEIILATDLRVWPTGMGNVVAVERHHVTEHVCTRTMICSQGTRQGKQILGHIGTGGYGYSYDCC